MSTNYKISGSYIRANGFPALKSRFQASGEYDLSDVCYIPGEDGNFEGVESSMPSFTAVNDENMEMEVIKFLPSDIGAYAIKTLPLPYSHLSVGSARSKAIIKGTYPRFSRTDGSRRFFLELATPGKYYIQRSDDALTISVYSPNPNGKGQFQSYQSIGAESFPEGIVPYAFIFEIQGGGGGGAGSNYYHTSAVIDRILDGAGGGGGAYALGILKFDTSASPHAITVTCGAGGKGGDNAAVPYAIGGKGTSSIIHTDGLMNSRAYGIYAGGGTAGDSPVSVNGMTNLKAAGKGGTVYFNGDLSSLGAAQLSPTNLNVENQNLPIALIRTINGCDGGGPTNQYMGDNCASALVTRICDEKYQKGENIYTIAGGQGGTGRVYNQYTNPKDGGIISGSGGGGASASGNGDNCSGIIDGFSSGYGAGGAGSWYPTWLTGTNGGDGYVRLYY